MYFSVNPFRLNWRGLLPAAAFAVMQTVPQAFAVEGPLSLDEALRIAAAESRQLAAQDAAVLAAREMSVSAAQLPDPVLRAGIENLPVEGTDRFYYGRDFMTMRRIGVMQEFTREEKRSLRGLRGEREAEREAENRRLALAALQRGTALAWLERHYAEQSLAVLDAIIRDTLALIDVAETAYRGGRGNQGDVLAARAALVMQEDRYRMAERQARLAGIGLERWIGPDAGRRLAGPPEIRSVAMANATLEEDLRRHPQLAMLEKQAEVADVDARLALAATQPDWSVEVAYSVRGRAFTNMLSVGVSIPLQIARADRQNRDVAARQALADQARAQVAEARRERIAEARTWLAEWRSGIERLERIETSLLALARQRSDAALTAYRGNAGPIAAVLEARRNEQEVRLQALQLAGETARAWAQIRFLLPAFEAVAGGVK